MPKYDKPADITCTKGTSKGGAARVFRRYESGAVVVSQPMSNLLTLLDERPDLLSRLTARSAGTERRKLADKRR